MKLLWPLSVVAAFAVGFAIHSTFYIQWPFPSSTISTMYQSEIGSDLALSIDSAGKMTFGPEYDREAEAKKLIEVMRTMYLHEKAEPCENVNYIPPKGGVITINPGTAWPPLILKTLPTASRP